MVEMAGVYGGALELTCILNEAVITVSSTALVENGKLGKNTYALGSQINEGDFVSLDVTTANTYDATGGIPVVTLPTAANGIVGIVKSQPVFNKVPASTTGVWAAARLTAGDYRVATVVFPLMTMAVKALSDGDGTAILPSNPVSWSLGGDAYLDGGTTFTGAFSFHYNNAANTSILVGYSMILSGTSDADAVGMEVEA